MGEGSCSWPGQWGMLLDLSAAFDLVDPDLLITKLRIYGLESDFLLWITSYLTDRHQAVWLNHVLSDFLHCEVGVPQGSILGPLLFLIFFNDMPDTLESSVDSYADDTTVTATGKTVEEISCKLTDDCSKVSEWMRSNKLKLNPDKTHLITLGTQERLRKLSQKVVVKMDDIALNEDEGNTELLLGCHIQANLKWRKQVQFTMNKLKLRLAGVSKLKFICTYPIRKTVTEGIFNSVLVYCLPLYGGLDVGDLKDLQVLQNKAAQIVTCSPPRSLRIPMYEKTGWLTVNQLVVYHTVINVYKIRCNKEPEALYSMLAADSRNSRIIIPNMDLSLAQKGFSIRGAEYWNKLPLCARQNSKISQFKKQDRAWILSNVPRFLD